MRAGTTRGSNAGEKKILAGPCDLFFFFLTMHACTHAGVRLHSSIPWTAFHLPLFPFSNPSFLRVREDKSVPGHVSVYFLISVSHHGTWASAQSRAIAFPLLASQ